MRKQKNTTKVAELNKANKSIAELTKLLTYAKDKAVEADKLCSTT
jgi:hypothetical protein